MPALQQWVSTWSQLYVEPDDALYQVFDALIKRYSEPQRHYHTVRHLDECLVAFEEIRNEASNPGEIELALWFHDAIYDVKASDNESRSADWARSVAISRGVSREAADNIHRLVMATRHSAIPADVDEQIIVDVDLSILGAEPDRFDEYEKQIRREYSWVPAAVFRCKRRCLLRAFLDRDTIFNTTAFRERFEARARDNIRRSLEVL